MPNRDKSRAKVATRDFRPLLIAGFIAFVLIALFASQASAQKKGDDASELLLDGIDTCGNLVDAGVDAEAHLIANGWTVEEGYQYGPYSLDVSGSSFIDDATESYVLAVIESYPGIELGFCTYDVYGFTGDIDLNQVTEIYDATGDVAQDEFGYWHGSWAVTDGDTVYLLLAHFEAENDYLLVQMNRIGAPTGSASAEPEK